MTHLDLIAYILIVGLERERRDGVPSGLDLFSSAIAVPVFVLEYDGVPSAPVGMLSAFTEVHIS